MLVSRNTTGDWRKKLDALLRKRKREKDALAKERQNRGVNHAAKEKRIVGIF